MDEYVNKVYEQFISEGGRIQRNILKEERANLKSDAAAAATARYTAINHLTFPNILKSDAAAAVTAR